MEYLLLQLPLVEPKCVFAKLYERISINLLIKKYVFWLIHFKNTCVSVNHYTLNNDIDQTHDFPDNRSSVSNVWFVNVSRKISDIIMVWLENNLRPDSLADNEIFLITSILSAMKVPYLYLTINSLFSERCDCDLKCVNLRHNMGVDILSIKVNISQEWMSEDHVGGKSTLLQVMGW